MKTIQLMLDEELIREVDQNIKKLNTSRSAFTREALRRNLVYHHRNELEKRHGSGYETLPVTHGEFNILEDEQVWPD